MAQQGFEEDLLRRWFPDSAEYASTLFTENDIRGIADVLTRCARERWSRVPRLYSILRKIGQLDAIDAFIDSEITDVYFPFNKNTLPEALRDHSARLQFLELQYLVYNTEALNLERHARHGHFGDSKEVPLKKVGELGKGGFGYVDRVVSTISHQEYARKLILRGRTFKKDKQVLKDFTKELSNLKRLSHRHLVELVGSYTDKKFVAIVMLPVADTNLQTFMERPDLDERSRSFLRPFFGCLTSALSYLHDHQIRHKDIKPSNVLIKNDQVYFTDFGTSLDWSGRDNSTTVTAAPTTPRYCAPEVMAYLERNSAADLWSLGCVFLEMWTILRCRTIKDLRTHMGEQGTGIEAYHSNPEGISSWIALLQRLPGPSSDLIPAEWIVNMLHQKPQARWNIHTLDNYIAEASIESSIQHTFKGICCLDLEDETSEDSQSSIEDSDSQLTPEDRSQDAPSFTNIEEAPRGQNNRRSILVNTSVAPFGSKDLDRNNGRSHSNLPQHNAESSPSSGEDPESRGQRPARMHVNATGKFPDDANTEDNEPNRVVSSDMNHQSCSGEERAPEESENTPSSSDESHTSDPLHRVPTWNPPSAEIHQLEATQTIDNQILCLRSPIDGIDSIPRSSSPIRGLVEHDIKRPEAIFPQTELETNATTDFDNHARGCSRCYNPLSIYLGDRQLCEVGYLLAHDVLHHICRFVGKSFRTNKRRFIPNAIVPVFKVEQCPSLGIASKYVQVKSLLKAVERSMLNGSRTVLRDGLFYSEGSPSRLGYVWVALHMCVICRRPLGRRNKEPVSINALSCTHQVHKGCKMGLEGLDCPNEQYCSICPGSTPVIQKPQRILSSVLSSVDTPSGNSSKQKDVGDDASQGDVGTSSARNDKPKTRVISKSKRPTVTQPTRGLDNRQLPVLDRLRSYSFAPQPTASHHSMYEPTQHQYVPREAEGGYSFPSRNSFEFSLDRGRRLTEPKHAPIYDPEAPARPVLRRPTVEPRLPPSRENLTQARLELAGIRHAQRDLRNVSPTGAVREGFEPARHRSPVGQRRSPFPREEQVRHEFDETYHSDSASSDENTDDGYDDTDDEKTYSPRFRSEDTRPGSALSTTATNGYGENTDDDWAHTNDELPTTTRGRGSRDQVAIDQSRSADHQFEYDSHYEDLYPGGNPWNLPRSPAMPTIRRTEGSNGVYLPRSPTMPTIRRTEDSNGIYLPSTDNGNFYQAPPEAVQHAANLRMRQQTPVREHHEPFYAQSAVKKVYHYPPVTIAQHAAELGAASRYARTFR